MERREEDSLPSDAELVLVQGPDLAQGGVRFESEALPVAGTQVFEPADTIDAVNPGEIGEAVRHGVEAQGGRVSKHRAQPQDRRRQARAVSGCHRQPATGARDDAADLAAARTLVDEWVRCGLTDAVICPGSRSTPMRRSL